MYFKFEFYSCDGKAEFSASLIYTSLQCHMILQK